MGAMDHGRQRREPRTFRSLVGRILPVLIVGILAIGVLTLVDFDGGAPVLGPVDTATGGAAPNGGASSSASATPSEHELPAGTTNRVDAAPADEVSAFIAPASAGQLAPGADLPVVIDVVNKTDTERGPGELVVSFDTSTLDSRAEFGAWTDPAASSNEPEPSDEALRVDVGAVPAGEVVTVEANVPAASIRLDDTAEFGPRGIAVQYVVDGAPAAQGRSSVVYATTPDAQPTPLSVVVPIVPPLGSPSVLGAEYLASLTAPDGQLTELLDAVEGTSATVAIDPRILVSIRALGENAPGSAAAWLERLVGLENQSFELPYADADLTLQRQAGLAQPLELLDASFAVGPVEESVPDGADDTVDATAEPEPTSESSTPSPSDSAATGDAPTAPTTDDATDAATGDNTASATGDSAGEGEPDATASPTETAVPDSPEELPTLDELTAFPYTLEGVAWPSDGTLSDGDLATFGSWGYRAVLVDEGNVERVDSFDFTPAADVNLDGWSALAADSQLSGAFELAASAESEGDLSAAVAQISTVLAIVSRELPYEPRTVFATAGHAAATDPQALGAALRAVDALPWSAPGTMTIPDLSTGEVAEATLRGGAHGEAVVNRFNQLLTAEARASDYATMFDVPELFRSERRADLLATTSAAWHQDVDAWIPWSQSYLDNVTATEASVVITESSDIQLVGRETELPIFVRNDTGRTVTLQVGLEPTSGRLEAGEPVTLRIEPGSMARAQVPVQAISNGNAVVDVRILTPDGVALLSTQSLQVNVQAEWETVTMIVAVVGLTTLFVWGIIRTIRRRRREKVDVLPSGEARVNDEG